MKALTQDEILKVLKAVSDTPRDLAMILLAFRHGMRASEVCNLKLADVDLKNGEITIRRLKGSLKTVQPLSDMAGQPLFFVRPVGGVLRCPAASSTDFAFVVPKRARNPPQQTF